MSQPTKFVIPSDQGRLRLDLAIGQHLGIGRAQVKKVLEAGQVRVNGRRAALKNKGDFLEPGTEVEISEFQRAEDLRAIAQPEIELKVLAEGDGWAVVDKPPGMAVHPLTSDETGTVLNAAVARWPEIHGIGEGGLRSGVVHRLDVETSGVLVLAMRRETWERFRRAFSDHRTKKVYRAIVEGTLSGQSREVMDLLVTQHRPARVSVIEPGTGPSKPPGTRECQLGWHAVESLNGATVIEVELGTGFLHQIRVMMASLGHPIAGDAFYGSTIQTPRQMLHASYLQVDEIRAQSPDPADFAATLSRLKGSDRA